MTDKKEEYTSYEDAISMVGKNEDKLMELLIEGDIAARGKLFIEGMTDHELEMLEPEPMPRKVWEVYKAKEQENKKLCLEYYHSDEHRLGYECYNDIEIPSSQLEKAKLNRFGRINRGGGSKTDPNWHRFWIELIYYDLLKKRVKGIDGATFSMPSKQEQWLNELLDGLPVCNNFEREYGEFPNLLELEGKVKDAKSVTDVTSFKNDSVIRKRVSELYKLLSRQNFLETKP